MRAQHEGTIQNLPNKRYRGAVMIDGKRIYGPPVEQRKLALPALWTKINQQQKEIDEELNPTLSISVKLRIRIMRNSGSYSPTTIEHWESALKAINRTELKDVHTRAITNEQVEEFAANFDGAKRTAKNYADVIKRVCKIEKNPLDVRLSSGRSERNIRLLTPVEQRELLAADDLSPELRLMIHLTLWVGLRRSEVAGLMHEDRKEDGIEISRAVVRTKGQISIKDTKTAASNSWIPLPDELLAEIGNGKKGFVFGNGAIPVSPSTLDDRWRRYVEKHPRWKGVGLHDFRRTYLMNLLEAGVDVKTAAELGRHDVMMLLELYTKSRKDLKQAAMKKLAESRRCG